MVPQRSSIDLVRRRPKSPVMARALIIGSSGGIGSALFAECEGRFGMENVIGLSRTGNGLDVTSEPSVEAVMNRLSGAFELIFVATGALQIGGRGPEKALKQVTAKSLRDQWEVNALGPALLLKHGLKFLPRDRRAVFAVLSARVGSIGDNGFGGWYGYRAAKAAVNQIVHTAPIEIARTVTSIERSSTERPARVVIERGGATIATLGLARWRSLASPALSERPMRTAAATRIRSSLSSMAVSASRSSGAS